MSFRSAALVLLGLHAGCSCRELPVIGGNGGSGGSGSIGAGDPGGGGVAGMGGTAGMGAGGGTGGMCGGADFLNDAANCGACTNTCDDDVQCVAGACRFIAAPDGALALTIDSINLPQRLVWGHATYAPVQSTLIQTRFTENLGELHLPFELVGVDGTIGMIENPNPAALNPGECSPPVWFGATSAPPPTSECRINGVLGSCLPASDFAVNPEVMAWTGEAGNFARLPLPYGEQLAGSATSLSYSVAPVLVALAGDGSEAPGAPLPIRYTSDLGQLGSTTLPQIGFTIFRPRNMVNTGSILFWLGTDASIQCADLSIMPATAVRYAALPDAGTALELANGELYIAIAGGLIVSGPSTCSPQGTLDILVNPPAVTLFTLALAATQTDLFFTRSAAQPSDNPIHGGVYRRPLDWPPLASLTLSP